MVSDKDAMTIQWERTIVLTNDAWKTDVHMHKSEVRPFTSYQIQKLKMDKTPKYKS